MDEAVELVCWRMEGGAPAATGDRIHLLLDAVAHLGNVEQRAGRAIDGDGVPVELELHYCGKRCKVGGGR